MARRLGACLFILAAAAVAGLNAWWIARGLATGAVPSLHKYSNAAIHRAAEPGLFALNLGIRAIVALVFGGWAAWLIQDSLAGRRGD